MKLNLKFRGASSEVLWIQKTDQKKTIRGAKAISILIKCLWSDNTQQ